MNPSINLGSVRMYGQSVGLSIETVNGDPSNGSRSIVEIESVCTLIDIDVDLVL